MAAPFVPKPPRGRIPISDADRAAARAGMDGEKTKHPSEGTAPVPAQAQPVAPVVTEPVAPAAVAVQPVAPVAPFVESTPVTEPVATAALEPITTGLVPEPMPIVAPATTPLNQPISPPTVTATPSRRGRKPAAAAVAVEPPAVRSVKIRESVWGDIKLILAQLPREESTPRNIQAYVEAAHQHYEALLRKQGKLPSK